MELTPAVYEHAAKIISCRPWDVSRDPELLFQAHSKAFDVYAHTPVVVGIDIYNLEAEAYGAVIAEPEGNDIPAISDRIVSGVADVKKLRHYDPKSDGRIAMVIQTAVRLAETYPEADVRVPVSGPFSILSNLIGFDNLLCELLTSPDDAREALELVAEGQVNFCREIVSNGVGIAFFESAATPPLVSPEMFRDLELPVLKRLISKASEAAGRPVPCVIGGNTEPVLEAIIETKTGYVICPVETDQQTFMKKMEDHPEVMVRINTAQDCIVSGNMDAVRKELDRVLALAKGREKVCIGTGALPYETDPEVVLEMRDYVSAKNSS